jgi:hypothetical protein
MVISIHKLIIIRKIGEPAPGGHIVPKKEILPTNLFIFKSRLSSKKIKQKKRILASVN